MAYLRPYRVAETATTTGTGAITLAGAVTGYLAFAAELANADTATIVIEAVDAAGRPTGAWEICDSTFTAPATLSRGNIRDSSAGGSRIDFAAGNKRVFAINPRDLVDLGSADLIGTLPVANGGTGVTTSTGTTSVVLSNSPVLVTPTLGVASATSIATGLGAVGTPSYTFTGDANTGMWSPGADTIAFSEGGVEAMRINSSGNVGIGTSSPAEKFTVNSASSEFAIQWSGPGNEWALASAANRSYIRNKTAGVETLTILNAGNVGIGTTAPVQRLHVRQDQDGTTAALIQNRNGSGTPISAVQFISGAFDLSDNRYAMISSAGGSNTTLQFWTGQGATPTEKMRITSAGFVGIGTSAPSTSQILTLNSGGTATPANGGLAGLGIINTDVTTSGTTGVIASLTDPGGTGRHAAAIAFGKDGTWTAGSAYPGNIQFWTRPNSTASEVEAMRIDSSGNVGIGTTAPTTIFHVQQNTTANVGMRMRQLSTAQFAGAGLLCNGPVSSSTQGGTAFYHYNRNTGGTNGALAMAQFDENGSFQRSLAEYYYNEQAWLFYTNGSERLRITSAGNVGIGTTSPAQRIHAATTAAPSGTTQSFLRLTGDATYGADFGGGIIQGVGPIATISTINAGTATERMRIASDGNVGIGETSPGARLHVSGLVVGTTAGNLVNVTIDQGGAGSNAVGVRTNLVRVSNGTDWTTTAMRLQGRVDATNFGYIDFVSGGAQGLAFGSDASERMRITSAGNVGIGTSSPSERLDTGTGNTRTQALVISGDQHLLYSADASTLGIRIGTGGPYYGIGTTGSNNMRINSSSGGDMLFAISGTERMRIVNGGNVGIGTSAPSFAKLQVSNAGAEGFEFSPAASAGVNRILSYNRTTNAYNTLRLEGSSQEFYVSGIERMRVASSGNVGIGTSAPSYTLQVNAASGGNQVAYFVNDSAASTLAGIASSINGGGNNTNSFHFAGVTQTVAIWYLYGNGTTSYTSDIRVKKNVTTTRDGYLEDVCKLRVVKYNWYNDSDDTPRELGFIAQEVEQVFPGLVQDALHPTKDGEIHKVLKGSVMMPIMLKALQEASAKIDALTARVAQLEGN